MLKEPVVMAMMGPMVLSLHWLATKHRRGLALGILVLGAVVTAMVKAYVLMALSISAATFYLWGRLLSRDNPALKPFAIITAAALGLGGLVLGARYFAKTEEGAADTLATQRQKGYLVEGGSNFSLEGVEDPGTRSAETRSVARELALVPLALATALFRPFIFEAKNGVQAINALETTMILVLLIQTIRRRKWRAVVDQVLRSPVLMFCLVFVMALSLGTGLSSTNLGTLSRYRSPMTPFLFALLLVLWSEGRTAVTPPPATRLPERSAPESVG